jgi:nucleotide-binding universal stress UspA family protein
MLHIKKILLPVDFPNVSLNVIHQAAMLARHFRAQILMLHVATQLSHAAGVPVTRRDLASWDLLAAIIRVAQKQQDQSLGSELAGLSIQLVLGNGDTAQTIIQTAEREHADLIMMPSSGFTFDQFLLGSVTGKESNTAACPVWTDANVEETGVRQFAIRNILCAVDLGPRSRNAVFWTAQFAAGFGGCVTLAHVTAAVELWGPGGWYINEAWKKELISSASRRIAELQRDTGVVTEVFIGSGDVPKVLSQAVKQTGADLLVTGTYPYGGRLRTYGYGIICAVSIPVLSV